MDSQQKRISTTGKHIGIIRFEYFSNSFFHFDQVMVSRVLKGEMLRKEENKKRNEMKERRV